MRKNVGTSSSVEDENEEIYPETCCVAIPVTLGTTILSVLTIISCAVSFTSGVLMLKDHYVPPNLAARFETRQLEVIAYSVIAVSAVLFVIAALAIHAVVARKPALVVPFFVVLVFSCVLNFVVLLDWGNRWVRHNDYDINRHFWLAFLVFVLKVYFTNSVYQCYQYLRAHATRRARRCGTITDAPRTANAYVILPKYEDLADIQPPAYKI